MWQEQRCPFQSVVDMPLPAVHNYSWDFVSRKVHHLMGNKVLSDALCKKSSFRKHPHMEIKLGYRTGLYRALWPPDCSKYQRKGSYSFQDFYTSAKLIWCYAEIIYKSKLRCAKSSLPISTRCNVIVVSRSYAQPMASWSMASWSSLDW